MELLKFDETSLAVDRFGSPRDPTVLLIAGGAQSMDWWTPEFCQLLSSDGLHVIRCDHRDTGQSTASPPGLPRYTGDDLSADPLRILDAFGIDAAHLVGLSMGGGIAQYIGVHSPDRVRTLTLIETTPVGGAPGPLPPPAVSLQSVWADGEPDIDWSDTTSVIAHRVEAERPYAGSAGFDEERTRAIATIEVHRSLNMESSMTNHFLVGSGTTADPNEIRVPTLVVHSTSDPLFPLDHGKALAQMIPDSSLMIIEGMGHETPPPPVWELLLQELRQHLK